MFSKLTKQYVTLDNGETLAYVEQGSGPEVVFLIHGNMSSSFHYEPLLKNIPAQYKVYAIDLRGFGDSSYHQRFDSLHELADDICLFAKKLGIERASVAGWSAGGGVAMSLAARHSKFVTKLFLIDSGSYQGYPVLKKDATGKPILEIYHTKEEMGLDPIQVLPVVKALADKNYAIMDYLWNLAIYTVNKPDAESNKIWIDETLKQRCVVDLDWALATFNLGHTPTLYTKGTGLVDLITMPVMSVWGNKDITVNEAMVKDTVAAIGDNATLKIYDNCGHSPLVDNIDELANDFLSFIKA